MRHLGTIGLTFMLVDAFLAGAEVGRTALTREHKKLDEVSERWPFLRSPSGGAWLDALWPDDGTDDPGFGRVLAAFATAFATHCRGELA